MHLKKKILLGLFIGFIAIQFIQPARYINDKILPSDIQKMYSVPDSVLTVMQISCYDCHSNNIHYPWYSFIQPGAWLMASHTRKGKAMLNFSQFGDLTKRKQRSKLTGIVNLIKDGEMPLSSYNIIHQNANLSASQKNLVTNWATKLKDSLSLKH